MSDLVDPNKVVILDRDGTLVIDRGYLADPDGLEFTVKAPEALRLLTEHGYRLIVITNQSGVGRGLFSIEDLELMNLRLHAMVEEAGAHLARIYFCPHSPDENCDCRKPRVGLMTQAVAEFHFDPQHAVVIGDRDSDLEFAQRAGARAILISSESDLRLRIIPSRATARNLLEAALSITSANEQQAIQTIAAASEIAEKGTTESALPTPTREFFR